MVAPMDRPPIAEDERFELDELMDAAVRDRSVPQHLFQLHQASQPARQIKEAVAVMPPFLIDPILVLLEFGPGAISVDLHPICRKPVVSANLFVQRGVDMGGRGSRVKNE